MGQHPRATLGPAGRIELARLQVEGGLSERAAAAVLSTSHQTARRWKLRRLRATAAELESGACEPGGSEPGRSSRWPSSPGSCVRGASLAGAGWPQWSSGPRSVGCTLASGARSARSVAGRGCIATRSARRSQSGHRSTRASRRDRDSIRSRRRSAGCSGTIRCCPVSGSASCSSCWAAHLPNGRRRLLETAQIPQTRIVTRSSARR